MAIIKSAKKAIRSSERKAVYNLRRKRTIKLIEKDITKLLAEGKKEEAAKLLPDYYKKIDKAAKMGTLKDNTASRRKSKMSRMIKVAGEVAAK